MSHIYNITHIYLPLLHPHTSAVSIVQWSSGCRAIPDLDQHQKVTNVFPLFSHPLSSTLTHHPLSSINHQLSTINARSRSSSSSASSSSSSSSAPWMHLMAADSIDTIPEQTEPTGRGVGSGKGKGKGKDRTPTSTGILTTMGYWNTCTSNGYTALHWATRMNHIAVVHCLIAAGSDKNLGDDQVGFLIRPIHAIPPCYMNQQFEPYEPILLTHSTHPTFILY